MDKHRTKSIPAGSSWRPWRHSADQRLWTESPDQREPYPPPYLRKEKESHKGIKGHKGYSISRPLSNLNLSWEKYIYAVFMCANLGHNFVYFLGQCVNVPHVPLWPKQELKLMKRVALSEENVHTSMWKNTFVYSMHREESLCRCLGVSTDELLRPSHPFRRLQEATSVLLRWGREQAPCLTASRSKA